MIFMDTVKDKILEALSSTGDGEPTSEHRAWMNAEVRTTLDRKERGEITYHSLDDVRREFGLDAS